MTSAPVAAVSVLLLSDPNDDCPSRPMVELSEVDVKSTDDSRFLQSNDRILNGHYQCSEIFKVDAPEVSLDAPMKLRGVTVNYSARRRDTLAAAAKLFAQAVGLGEADLKTVGAESSQGYQWEKVNEKERRLYVVELRFAREDGLWKMYFSTAFYVVEP